MGAEASRAQAWKLTGKVRCHFNEFRQPRRVLRGLPKAPIDIDRDESAVLCFPVGEQAL
jgi:hypothetical protein